MGDRNLLFSLTAKDFKWDFYNGSGNGGQNRNKTQACVRCSHPPSGAVGKAEDERSQAQNKQLAFKRCIETQIFKTWHKLEVAKRSGLVAQVESTVDAQMRNLKTETRDESGRWVETAVTDLKHED